MSFNARLVCAVAALALIPRLSLRSAAQTPASAGPLSDRDIKQILVERIDRQQQSLGIVPRTRECRSPSAWTKGVR